MKEISSDSDNKVSDVVCRSPQRKKEGSWLGLYISLMSALSPLLVHQEQNCHMWLLASYPFLKDKSKVVFLMPEIVLITSCSHLLISLYKGLGHCTLAEALDPALFPRANNAPATVSLSRKLGLGFVAIMSTKAMKSDLLRGQQYPIRWGYRITMKKLRNLQKIHGESVIRKVYGFSSVLE